MCSQETSFFSVRPIFNANSYTGSEGGTIVGNLVISGLSGEGSLRSGSLVYKIEAFKGINDRGLATYGELFYIECFLVLNYYRVV